MENVTAAQVKDALERVIASFQTVLYEDDEQFLENMKTKNLEGDDIRRYQHRSGHKVLVYMDSGVFLKRQRSQSIWTF